MTSKFSFSALLGTLMLAIAGVLGFVGRADALTAYYFVDGLLGRNDMATALSNLGYTVTSTNSAATLGSADLSGFDVVIALVSGSGNCLYRKLE